MPLTAAERMRALGYAVIAAIYYYLAQSIAVQAANGLSGALGFQLTERSVFLFLLIVGFAAMGRIFRSRTRPIRGMGLAFRSGWQREFGLGAALGWGMLLVAILPLVVSGGLLVSFSPFPRQFGLLFIDLLLLAVAALAEEVAFRGYPFQRLIEAIGPTMATLVSAVIFAAMHLPNPFSSRVSFLITFLASCFLSLAYLRTRALWVCWGWHFAWNAAMCLLFGLPVSGITRLSPVIQSNTVGPVWMTGGNYGPEASTVTVIVLLAGLFLLVRVTRGYAYLYTQPVIVSAGMPVDLDAMSRTLAPHHPLEPVVPPAGSTLVQISAPIAPQPPPQVAADVKPNGE